MSKDKKSEGFTIIVVGGSKSGKTTFVTSARGAAREAEPGRYVPTVSPEPYLVQPGGDPGTLLLVWDTPSARWWPEDEDVVPKVPFPTRAHAIVAIHRGGPSESTIERLEEAKARAPGASVFHVTNCEAAPPAITGPCRWTLDASDADSVASMMNCIHSVLKSLHGAA